ncbi:hypothetical protein AK88_05516 [Plasmodium fragile]|uniref:Schizont-infected cell agglutination C-terminal domain-containing protein n=2 Tax=Plasmodium fragile TaxID=5857 RepID=A0A0D9QDE8_PLAFR|nr:uncharacterized protein AK88_05516 [Plasmodium fragile]KJP84852.1 hypothetical protein AK88_05516 [Plasmodium fragile]
MAMDILEFLGAWQFYLNRWNIKDGKGYWKQLMREVKIIFNEVTTIITQHSGTNAGICGSVFQGKEPAACKSRCHEIASLMLYIKGYSCSTGNCTKRRVDARRGEKFREYIRCTLATEVLLQLYGNNADHREIIQHVKAELEKPDKPGQQQYEPGVCEGRDYGEVIFGLRGIGPSIKNKLDEWKKGFARRTTGTTHGRVQKCAWKEQDADQKNEEACTAHAGVIPQDSALMTKIKAWTDSGIFARVKSVLDDMQQTGASKEICEIEKKIKKGVKAVKDRVNPPKKPTTSTGTSSSAGGSDAAAGEKGKTAKAEDCPLKTILEDTRRQVYVLKNYNKEQLETMKTVLQQFIDYMDDPDGTVDALGANCYNSGWNDITDDGTLFTGQTVADVIRCKLMTGALWFANGDNIKGYSTVTDDTENRLRCELANAFGYILDKKYCEHKTTWKRGVKYAWTTVNAMGEAGGIQEDKKGPVMKADCTECGYKVTHGSVRVVDGHMVNLLIEEGKIMDKIGNIAHRIPCGQDWKKYKEEKGVKDQDHDISQKLPDVKNTESEIRTQTKKAFEEVTKIVDQKIKEQDDEERAGKDKNNKNTKNTHNPNTFSTTTPTGTKPQAPPTTVPEVPEEPVPEEKGPPQGPGAERGDRARAETGASETVPAAASIPQPPPAAPPPSQSSSGSGSGTTVSKDTKETGKCSKGTETYTVKNAGAGVHGSTSSTSVSFGTTSDIDSTCGKKPEDSGPGSLLRSAETPSSSTGPVPRSTGGSTESGGTPPGKGAAGGGEDINENTNLCAIDGKKDKGDWTCETDGPAETVGGEESDSTPRSSNFGLPNFDLANMIPKGPNVPGGGFVPLKREHVTLNEDNEKLMKQGPPSRGGPDAPDLAAAVLTATTPILLFVASVTVALLGYSLWKYFAYLGKKRRRTYRTVRDVPSPPLDEEILDHLQRGELPPPDYGYTMIRDRQPGRLPADRRRRRPPRVHKRTIIELHLEVLNECAATEWATVKDDYLQIVVEVFAQELMRDVDTHNSILGVSTSDQGPPGTNVSFTLDAPTDADGTHTSPPNEDDPDPWSCMEHIQLETDPSASNDEDYDPWSCMETIQLEHEHTPSPLAYSSDPGNDMPALDRTKWIPWIDRNKRILQQSTAQPWFLQLKADWKQYQLMKKLHAWKQWVEQQHRKMSTYKEEAWFKHLLHNVQEATVSEKGEVSVVEKDLEVDKVMAAEDLLQVSDVPRSQPLPQQPYMKKSLTAQTWILILALVIEQCEVERSLQDRELYVDDLLQKL